MSRPDAWTSTELLVRETASAISPSSTRCPAASVTVVSQPSNPRRSTITRYVPAGTAAQVNTPSSPDAPQAAVLLSAPVSVTPAPGIAASLASSTVPRTVPDRSSREAVRPPVSPDPTALFATTACPGISPCACTVAGAANTRQAAAPPPTRTNNRPKPIVTRSMPLHFAAGPLASCGQGSSFRVAGRVHPSPSRTMTHGQRSYYPTAPFHKGHTLHRDALPATLNPSSCLPRPHTSLLHCASICATSPPTPQPTPIRRIATSALAPPCCSPTAKSSPAPMSKTALTGSPAAPSNPRSPAPSPSTDPRSGWPPWPSPTSTEPPPCRAAPAARHSPSSAMTKYPSSIPANTDNPKRPPSGISFRMPSGSNTSGDPHARRNTPARHHRSEERRPRTHDHRDRKPHPRGRSQPPAQRRPTRSGRVHH